MPLVTRTGQVSFAPKGDKGDKGARMRMRVWGASVSYLEGKQGQQFYDIVLYDNLLYLCIRSHTSVSTEPPKQNVASGKIKYWEVAQSWTFIATKLLLTEKIKASMIDADGIMAVNVDISGKNSQVAVTVTDSGPGFDLKQLDKYLDPFFTTKDGGTGLGLPIVQSIITSHGGTVDIGNDPQTGGARVTMTLPTSVPDGE